MMTDPIADMLTRIRNGIAVEHQQVDIPMSKVKLGLAETLKREGYIWDFEVVDEGKPRNILRIHFKYGPNGEKLIRKIKRVSKPGCRVYSNYTDMKPVLGGLGIRIVSTSRGVISDREARQKKVGGEVLCEVW